MADFTTPQPFDLEEQRRSDLTILFARGRIEKHEVGSIGAVLNRLSQEGRKRVIVDLSEVTHLSSLTVTDLIAAAELFRSTGGEILVSGLSRSLTDVVRVIDRDDKMHLQTDVVAAIKCLSQPAGPSQ